MATGIAAWRGGLADNGAVLTMPNEMPGSGCSGSRRPCSGDDWMHHDNPAAKTSVAKLAAHGGPLPLGSPAQAARRFACLRTRKRKATQTNEGGQSAAALSRVTDLIDFSPDRSWRFNFLDFELNPKSNASGSGENVIALLRTPIEAAERTCRETVKQGEEGYLEGAQLQLLRIAEDSLLAARPIRGAEAHALLQSTELVGNTIPSKLSAPPEQ